MKFNLCKIIPLKFLDSNTSTNISTKSRHGFTIHRYLESNMGKEFFLEPLENCFGSYTMTSERSNVKSKDRILIQGQSKRRFYRIQEVDYYSGFSDLWVAKLSAYFLIKNRRYISPVQIRRKQSSSNVLAKFWSDCKNIHFSRTTSLVYVDFTTSCPNFHP